MRSKLQQYEGSHATFTGVFRRFGKRTTRTGETITTVLMTSIKNEDGEVVADHVWIVRTRGFDAVTLKPGDVVRFRAKVRAYEKGYRGTRDMWGKPLERDYKLSYPTNMEVVG